MRPETTEQLSQEAQYTFPYHYLDLESHVHRLRMAEYVNLLHQVTARAVAAGTTVLDAACGDGRLCRELDLAGMTVTGVDYSERAIAFARAFNPHVEFLVRDLSNLELGRTCDVVVLMEALEHIPPTDAPAVLERLARHVAPAGRLIVTVPSDKLPVPEKHYQHFTPTSLADTLAPWFDIVRLEGYCLQTAAAPVFRWLRRLSYLLTPVESLLRARALIDWPVRFYDRRLAIGSPERSAGLIATCVTR